MSRDDRLILHAQSGSFKRWIIINFIYFINHQIDHVGQSRYIHIEAKLHFGTFNILGEGWALLNEIQDEVIADDI